MNNLPDDDVGNALNEYLRLGSDLTREMDIDFFVAAPSREAALNITKIISSLGFKTSAEFDQETNEWTCYCSKSIIPKHETILKIEQILNEAAEEYGGYSDGFGSYGNAKQK